MDNLENSIRHKLEDAELTPPNDMWSRVEAQLPQEKKRRGLIWMMWLLPFCIAGAGVVLYNLNANEAKPEITQNIIAPEHHTNENINTNNNNIPPQNTVMDRVVPSLNPENRIKPNAGTTRNTITPRGIVTLPSNIPSGQFNSGELDNLTSSRKFNWAILAIDVPPIHKVNTYNAPKSTLPPTDQTKPDGKKSKSEKPCKIVFESVNNFYMSGRALVASKGANADQQNYIKLRNQIERPHVNFSGGVGFKFFINKHYAVGSGIRITHYSEDLIYNKRDVNVAFEAPPINIDEQVRKKYPYTFTKQTDSIYAGGNYYGGSNYYFFREVPITIGYYNYGSKYNFFIEPSISYCRITAIKASLLDLDHVGFSTINQLDGYQGLSHIFNASMRVGGGINFSKSVAVNGGLYFSRAITPLINYGYAKQLPYTYGITLGIEYRF